jgi:catechol 2,3-dioxygenase
MITAKEAGPIAAETGVGPVHISVTDGNRSLRFYQDVMGLTLISTEADKIHLGAHGRELLVLYPGASRTVVPGTAGLYHFAIVVPGVRDFARVVGRLISKRYSHAPTDHLMTKSDYLWDPDGNGIEVYAETPEDGSFSFVNGGFFARDRNGVPRSGRDPIDLKNLLSQLTPGDSLDEPMPEGTKMGHVHLHVADLDEAIHFYHDLIGFDIMGIAASWGAGFLSAGGYHHHIGLNTWAGVGAPPAPAGSSGLRHFTIELPTHGDVNDVVNRLRTGGVQASETPDGYFASDPSKNGLLLSARDPV